MHIKNYGMLSIFVGSIHHEKNRLIPMKIFDCLAQIREFEKKFLPFLGSRVDFDIVNVVGLYQERGEPLLLKQLYLEVTGSFATVSRRLALLRRNGAVLAISHGADARMITLTLSPTTLDLYARYASLLTSLTSQLD